MKRRIMAFLDNESMFGQIMGKCWVLIGANLMFLITILPIVTIGPGLAALFHVCLKSLRSREILSPIREFWRGFLSNFKQALIVWLIFLAAAFILLMDIRITVQAGGGIGALRYVFYAMTGVGLIFISFLYPVMAAFSDTLPHLMRNAVFFIAKNPARALLVAALLVGPLVLTYADLARLPLYAFLWTMFGFAGIVMLISRLLIKDFNRFLPEIEDLEETAG